MISDLHTQLIRLQDREDFLTDLNKVLEWEDSRTAGETRTKFWKQLNKTIALIEEQQQEIKDYIKESL